jgi:hypothetical protein
MQDLADGRTLALAALASWLATEALGAFMLASWVASGGPRRRREQPDDSSLFVIFGHPSLAATGLACWVCFLAAGWAAAAWLALGLLALAIGLGISAVTIWTPYPARRGDAAGRPPAREGARRDQDAPAALGLSDELLTRALADEALAGMVVDDLLARALGDGQDAARGRTWRLQPLVPAVHGAGAIVTFMLATLATAVRM